MPTAEDQRLREDEARDRNWKRWGPYLAERQWGTVREDYSGDGDVWTYFPHDHARSRAYRWGEDGLLGITDREGRLCFALAVWNGRDPILKERLFGLSGHEGNHGEDVKECYYFLDATPTHSWMEALYKYPQAAFPYETLLEENRRRGMDDPEFELEDTGVFEDDRYFDIRVSYAKARPNDILIQVAATNRGPEDAELHLLPTLWFRNTWAWGRSGEGYWPRPSLRLAGPRSLRADHASLGGFRLELDGPDEPVWLFTENETNAQRLFGARNPTPWVKDAFHERVVGGRASAVNPAGTGTRAAAWTTHRIPPGETVTLRLRLFSEPEAPADPFADFDATLLRRRAEADDFYRHHLPADLTPDEQLVVRQAYAGLFWSKQFYHYIVRDWLEGDPAQPPPPPEHARIRNADWRHLYTRDVLSMPDTWEYPWFAAWDLAFHMIPFARLDPLYAKQQLILLLREWYLHPNGELPAYEFAFDDVNPPVHAWAVWRVYKMTAPRERRDREFLAGAFQKLLMNFTWWVNRKDLEGNHLFSGGFLGLDNVGLFDRSKPLPTGGHLEQADGTAWMAFYCGTMLAMALELADSDPAYEDIASKFFEHFIDIADAMNALGGTGLWHEEDGFYYDQLHVDGWHASLRVRSVVGLVPLLAVELLNRRTVDRLPGFADRLNWFLANRKDLTAHLSCDCGTDASGVDRWLLAMPSRERLARVLRYVADEREFLSPYGLRSLSRFHADHPSVFDADGREYRVDYQPAESRTREFGGNSNWRGPVWFPINFLLIEALERYHLFYGDGFQLEFPAGSGRSLNLGQIAADLSARLAGLFLPGPGGRRPCHGDDTRYAVDPHWKDLVLFYEFFNGDTGRGLGASHQTGWTALAAICVEQLSRRRAPAPRAW